MTSTFIFALLFFFFLSDGFFSFAGSLPPVTPPAPNVEKEVVDTPVPPVEPRVEEPSEDLFTAPLLPAGSSLLDTLEAAVKADEEGGDGGR